MADWGCGFVKSELAVPVLYRIASASGSAGCLSPRLSRNTISPLASSNLLTMHEHDGCCFILM
jgi:hypothetical protein